MGHVTLQAPDPQLPSLWARVPINEILQGPKSSQPFHSTPPPPPTQLRSPGPASFATFPSLCTRGRGGKLRGKWCGFNRLFFGPSLSQSLLLGPAETIALRRDHETERGLPAALRAEAECCAATAVSAPGVCLSASVCPRSPGSYLGVWVEEWRQGMQG